MKKSSEWQLVLFNDLAALGLRVRIISFDLAKCQVTFLPSFRKLLNILLKIVVWCY